MRYVVVLLPSIGVAGLFLFAFRAILGADKKEREAQNYSNIEAGSDKQ